MSIKRVLFLLSIISVTGLASFPALSEGGGSSCDLQGKSIAHKVGSDIALEAFHILHGDPIDDRYAIDVIRQDNPEVEHELKAFIDSGCSEKDLESHAHHDH